MSLQLLKTYGFFAEKSIICYYNKPTHLSQYLTKTFLFTNVSFQE